jgi:cytochrome P450
MTSDTALISVFDAGLPILDYDILDSPSTVYPQIRAAQRAAPIAIGPVGPEILSFELARAMLRDQRFVLPPGITLMAQGVTSGPLWDKVTSSLIGLNGTEHQRLRGLVSRAFTPRATSRLDSTMQVVLNDLVDQVSATGDCEFVEDIARRYPIPIICALIGAPAEDWEKFSLWTQEVLKAFNFTGNIAEEESTVMAAWGELDDYVADMVAQRRHRLTDDLLSGLIRTENDGDRLTLDELCMIVAGLLMAGTDTTRTQLAASMFIFCEHADQWALLAKHPDLAMRAVDESMRHSPAAFGTMRIATDDVEFGGYLFPRGTFTVVNTCAANRDPAIYDDAERFDIMRESPPGILTFGGGIHYCLGANLARLELAEALKILSTRMPNPRRVAPAPWKPMLGLSGPISLPIEFDPTPVLVAGA